MRLPNLIKACGLVAVYHIHQIQPRKAKYKIALLQALLLAYSLCSFAFSVLSWACWNTLQYNTSDTTLKSHFDVYQYFIAHHALTNLVQSLLTKPLLGTPAPALIQHKTRQSLGSQNLDTNLLKQCQTSYHFLSLFLQQRKFLNYLEQAGPTSVSMRFSGQWHCGGGLPTNQ